MARDDLSGLLLSLTLTDSGVPARGPRDACPAAERSGRSGPRERRVRDDCREPLTHRKALRPQAGMDLWLFTPGSVEGALPPAPGFPSGCCLHLTGDRGKSRHDFGHIGRKSWISQTIQTTVVLSIPSTRPRTWASQMPPWKNGASAGLARPTPSSARTAKAERWSVTG
jgi:hypothetical protein